jgi:hypothetical protein
MAAITKNRNFFKWSKLLYFSNGGHLGYRTALMDTILKGNHLRIISAKFGGEWLSSFRGEDFFSNLNCISIMMSFLTCITGFFMNFELLPILTD